MKKILLMLIFVVFAGQLYAQEAPSLTGTTWRLVEQTPSDKELLEVMFRYLGVYEEGDEDAYDEMLQELGGGDPVEKLIITDNKLMMETSIDDMNIDTIEMPYHQEGDQLIIDGPNHTNSEAFPETLFPQYVTITEFTGDELRLTTDNMPIFGDNNVSYHYVLDSD